MVSSGPFFLAQVPIQRSSTKAIGKINAGVKKVSILISPAPNPAAHGNMRQITSILCKRLKTTVIGFVCVI